MDDFLSMFFGFEALNQVPTAGMKRMGKAGEKDIRPSRPRVLREFLRVDWGVGKGWR